MKNPKRITAQYKLVKCFLVLFAIQLLALESRGVSPTVVQLPFGAINDIDFGHGGEILLATDSGLVTIYLGDTAVINKVSTGFGTSRATCVEVLENGNVYAGFASYWYEDERVGGVIRKTGCSNHKIKMSSGSIYDKPIEDMAVQPNGELIVAANDEVRSITYSTLSEPIGDNMLWPDGYSYDEQGRVEMLSILDDNSFMVGLGFEDIVCDIYTARISAFSSSTWEWNIHGNYESVEGEYYENAPFGLINDMIVLPDGQVLVATCVGDRFSWDGQDWRVLDNPWFSFTVDKFFIFNDALQAIGADGKWWEFDGDLPSKVKHDFKWSGNNQCNVISTSPYGITYLGFESGQMALCDGRMTNGITGKVFFDVDKSGEFGASDSSADGISLLLHPVGLFTKTDQSGDFKFDVQPGNYSLHVIQDSRAVISDSLNVWELVVQRGEAIDVQIPLQAYREPEIPKHNDENPIWTMYKPGLEAQFFQCEECNLERGILKDGFKYYCKNGFLAKEKYTGPPGDWPSDIEQTLDGRMFISSNHGVGVWDGSTWEHFTIDNSPLPGDQVRGIDVGPEGEVIFATDMGWAEVKNDVWTVFKSENFQSDYSHLLKVVKLPSGVRYVLRDAGDYVEGDLMRFDDSSFIHIGSLTCHLTQGSATLVPLGDSTIIVESDYAPTYQVIDGQWKEIAIKEGNANEGEHVRQVVQLRNGDVWGVHDFALYKKQGLEWLEVADFSGIDEDLFEPHLCETPNGSLGVVGFIGVYEWNGVNFEMALSFEELGFFEVYSGIGTMADGTIYIGKLTQPYEWTKSGIERVESAYQVYQHAVVTGAYIDRKGKVHYTNYTDGILYREAGEWRAVAKFDENIDGKLGGASSSQGFVYLSTGEGGFSVISPDGDTLNLWQEMHGVPDGIIFSADYYDGQHWIISEDFQLYNLIDDTLTLFDLASTETDLAYPIALKTLTNGTLAIVGVNEDIELSIYVYNGTSWSRSFISEEYSGDGYPYPSVVSSSNVIYFADDEVLHEIALDGDVTTYTYEDFGEDYVLSMVIDENDNLNLFGFELMSKYGPNGWEITNYSETPLSEGWVINALLDPKSGDIHLQTEYGIVVMHSQDPTWVGEKYVNSSLVEQGLWPNPISDGQYLQFPIVEEGHNAFVTVYDVTGAIVLAHRNTQTVELGHSDFPKKGIYMVQIEQSGIWNTYRVIVE